MPENKCPANVWGRLETMEAPSGPQSLPPSVGYHAECPRNK